jgi:F-type H+-transporting ATPase subunit b
MKALSRLLESAGWAACWLLLAAAPVMAQQTDDSTESPMGWAFRWINFAVVMAVIAFAFRKAAPHFRRHAEQISERIAEGRRAREAAEEQRREAQAKLAQIPSEVAAMRVAAKRSAEVDAERLRELARAEAQMIEQAAQAEIAARERAARRELKTLAAHLAIERAEATLRERLTPQSEATLFGSFVRELEGKLN